MTAYCFFDVRAITDPDRAAAYRRGVLATVEDHGGEYQILGGEVEIVEGDWAPAIPVLIRFPSRAAARAWYESEVYRPFKALRLAAMDCRAVILEGCAPDALRADG